MNIRNIVIGALVVFLITSSLAGVNAADFTPNNSENNGGLVIMDPQGHYGVIEFDDVDNAGVSLYRSGHCGIYLGFDFHRDWGLNEDENSVWL